jgi:hypothetical protein
MMMLLFQIHEEKAFRLHPTTKEFLFQDFLESSDHLAKNLLLFFGRIYSITLIFLVTTH